MIRTAVLVDGGSLRIRTQQAGRTHSPDHIESVALACRAPDKQLIRILY